MSQKLLLSGARDAEEGKVAPDSDEAAITRHIHLSLYVNPSKPTFL